MKAHVSCGIGEFWLEQWNGSSCILHLRLLDSSPDVCAETCCVSLLQVKEAEVTEARINEAPEQQEQPASLLYFIMNDLNKRHLMYGSLPRCEVYWPTVCPTPLKGSQWDSSLHSLPRFPHPASICSAFLCSLPCSYCVYGSLMWLCRANVSQRAWEEAAWDIAHNHPQLFR